MHPPPLFRLFFPLFDERSRREKYDFVAMFVPAVRVDELPLVIRQPSEKNFSNSDAECGNF